MIARHWGKKGTESYYLTGIEFQFQNLKIVTEMDGDNVVQYHECI